LEVSRGDENRREFASLRVLVARADAAGAPPPSGRGDER